MARAVLAAFGVAAVAATGTACGGDSAADIGEPKPGRPRDHATALEAKERHADEIMAAEGVVGVGVGFTGPSTGRGIGPEEERHVIVVYLERPKHRPEGPRSLEGVPVRFEVTGKIRPLPAR
jgi:hypothetical protein